jgi:hypothetical protein
MLPFENPIRSFKTSQRIAYSIDIEEETHLNGGYTTFRMKE